MVIFFTDENNSFNNRIITLKWTEGPATYFDPKSENSPIANSGL